MSFNNKEEPFLIKRLDNISYKPILSVGNFISLDIECVVAGSSDRKLRFLDVDYLSEIASATMDKKNVSFVAISEMGPTGDDPVILTGGKDSIIQVWDPSAESIDRTSIDLPTTEVRSLAVYHGSKLLAVIGTKDGKVFVWDLKENKELVRFSGHTASVHCVCIANIGSGEELAHPGDDLNHLCIASGGADRVVRTWDFVSGKRVRKFRHQRSISSMIVANHGVRPLLATAGVERSIKLWDLDTGILLRTLTGHMDQINCLALWEGYQMILLSGSSDRTIRVYDMLSGECIASLQGHRDAVLSLTITDSENPKIVSSSEDLSLIQWDLQEMLDRFYYVDGDLLGSRNKEPPYLPTIEYQAPEELDRKALTKEERKKIRKERKKQQRLKNLLNDWSGGSTTSSFIDKSSKTTAEDYDDDDYDDNGKGDDNDNDNDNQRQDDYQAGPSSNQEQDQDQNQNQDPYYGEDGEQQHQEGEYEEGHEFEEEIPGFEDLDVDGEFEYEEGGECEKEDGTFSEAVTTTEEVSETKSSSRRPSVRKMLSLSSQMIVGQIIGNAMNRIAPDSGNTYITESASPVKSMIGKAFGLGGNAVAVEVVPAPSARRISHAPDRKKSVPGRGHGPPRRVSHLRHASDETKSPSSITAQQAADLRKSMAKEDNFKAQAAAAQTKYNIAVVEHQLATDRQKSKATQSLKARLESKKNKENTSSKETAPAAGGDGDDLEELKAQKLKQHKLQETRRRESMAIAQKRSALALQKRLEELRKTKTTQEENDIGTINEGDDDDDDSVD
jgi:WD40 repeat protein